MKEKQGKLEKAIAEDVLNAVEQDGTPVDPSAILSEKLRQGVVPIRVPKEVFAHYYTHLQHGGCNL